MRQDEQNVTKIARSSMHAQVMCMLRVSLFMLVVGLMLVLIARVIVIVLSLSFRRQFSVLRGILFTPPRR